jgi:hypothetical protein
MAGLDPAISARKGSVSPIGIAGDKPGDDKGGTPEID